MPSNIFATTGTNVSVIFLNKLIKYEDVLLVDASELGEKYKDGKNQRTRLREHEIEKIVDIFANRKEEKEFSVLVSCNDIERKNYCISAGQYFEAQIQNIDLTQEEFDIKIKNDTKVLKELFEQEDNCNKNILSSLEELKYDI